MSRRKHTPKKSGARSSPITFLYVTLPSSESMPQKQSKYVEWTAIIVSLVSLAFSLFPQLNPLSDDYRIKALAGSENAQYIYADQLFESGLISDSIYSYLTLSRESEKYQAAAQNNLACIYATQTSSAYQDYHHSLACHYFRSAGDAGIETAPNDLFSWLSLTAHNGGIDQALLFKHLGWAIEGVLQGVDPSKENNALPNWHFECRETVSMSPQETDLFQTHQFFARIEDDWLYYAPDNTLVDWDFNSLAFTIECNKFKLSERPIGYSLHYISYRDWESSFGQHPLPPENEVMSSEAYTPSTT